jgi:hypothetical protein
MNFTAIALALGAAFLTHTASFRVGSKRVNVKDTGGPPAHFTFAQALSGAEAALEGKTGVIVTSGDIQVTVDNWPT